MELEKDQYSNKAVCGKRRLSSQDLIEQSLTLTEPSLVKMIRPLCKRCKFTSFVSFYKTGLSLGAQLIAILNIIMLFIYLALQY